MQVRIRGLRADVVEPQPSWGKALLLLAISNATLSWSRGQWQSKRCRLCSCIADMARRIGEEELRLALGHRAGAIARSMYILGCSSVARIGVQLHSHLPLPVLGGGSLVVGCGMAVLGARLVLMLHGLRGPALDLRTGRPSTPTPAMVQRFSDPWARTRSHRTERGFMIGGRYCVQRAGWLGTDDDDDDDKGLDGMRADGGPKSSTGMDAGAGRGPRAECKRGG